MSVRKREREKEKKRRGELYQYDGDERSYIRGAGGVADIISAATTASSILMGGVIRGAHSLANFFFFSQTLTLTTAKPVHHLPFIQPSL